MQRAAPVPMPHHSPLRRGRWIVSASLILLVAGVAQAASPQYSPGRSTPFARAERLREALEGRPEQQRTRLQYERVLDAYRAIYHQAPASPKADASIAAVADLLAEEGRVFQDPKLLRNAIGQYEFLRHQYPASRFRFSALLTEGEIEQRDFGDLEQAKATYLSFLRTYPESALAVEARAELRNIHREQGAPNRRHASSRQASRDESTTRSQTGSHRNTILTAAIQSQTPQPRREFSTAPGESSLGSESATTSRSPTPSRTRSAGMEESDIPPLVPSATESSPSTVRSTGAEPATETPAAADLNTPPPPRRSLLPLMTGIRHWSTPVYTRVAIDLQQEVRYTAARLPDPDRIFFDLYGIRLSPELVGRSLEVTDDGFLSSIRVVQVGNNMVRVVLNVSSVSDYSAFFLANPSRLIIDVHGRRGGPPPMQTAQNGVIGAGIGIGPVEAQPPAGGANPVGSASSPASPARTQRTSAAAERPASPLADVATLSQQPNEVRATRRPTTAPVVASVAGTTPAAQPDADPPKAAARHAARSAK
ncbi:MAG: AMIN domain-containing protein, partial [Acidobacteriaceae bacterium]